MASTPRRHGDTAQLVNLQKSAWTGWEDVQFYINVGVAFDDICRHLDLAVIEKPKVYECSDRGFSWRAEDMVQSMDDHAFTVADAAQVDDLVEPLKTITAELVDGLDAIDSLAAYRSHPWFEVFRPWESTAVVLYLLDDLDAAQREVEAITATFADRPNALTLQQHLVELRMKRLTK